MRKELVILVDSLEEASTRHLQASVLASFGHLAALHGSLQHAGFNVGLCAVHKHGNGRDVQLKVHLVCLFCSLRSSQRLLNVCLSDVCCARHASVMVRTGDHAACSNGLPLCCMQQVLQRPGPFSPRDFHFAVQKLSASASPGTPEPLKTGECSVTV